MLRLRVRSVDGTIWVRPPPHLRIEPPRLGFDACELAWRTRVATEATIAGEPTIIYARRQEPDPLERQRAAAARARALGLKVTAPPPRQAPEVGSMLALQAQEVRRAYKRKLMAERAHPDLGGDARRFVELTRERDAALAALRSAE